MNRGPLPTRLVFLSELPQLPNHTKVRFLGCITRYSLSTGTLTLQHAYPALSSTCTRVEVNVDLLLDNLKSTDTQVGEWVNVTGYVQHTSKIPTEISSCNISGNQELTAALHKKARNAEQTGTEVFVQAVMLWSAEKVKLDEYEKALDSRRIVEKESPNTQRTADRR